MAIFGWIYVLYVFQVRSNGNQVMQFGKSKAKEPDEEAPKELLKM